jgi:hypothetical protein
MASNDSGRGGYVDRVREETQTYIHKLLAENETLHVALAEVEGTNHRLEQELRSLQEDIGLRRESEEALREKLQQIRNESDRYLTQYAQLEQHNTNLANLYVASYQLHGTLDRNVVIGAIQEIVVNLIGSEEFGIWERNHVGDGFRLVVAVGLPQDATVPAGAHVEAVTARGETWVNDGSGGSLTACIPLRLDGQVTGFIAIHRLLAHKTQLESLDHELFDLLATHAATALYCTSLQERLAVERIPA